MNENIFSQENKPNEEYIFSYTTDELTKLFKFQRKKIYKRFILSTVIFLIITVLAIISALQFSVGFSVGALVFTIINYSKGISLFNKSWESRIPKIAQTAYEYKIYDTYFIFNLYRNNEQIRHSKCYFEDIEKITKIDKWLMLQIGGQSLILRENDLKSNSVFLSYLQNKK